MKAVQLRLTFLAQLDQLIRRDKHIPVMRSRRYDSGQLFSGNDGEHV